MPRQWKLPVGRITPMVLALSAIAMPGVASAQSTSDPAAPDAGTDGEPVIEALSPDWTIRLEPYVGFIAPAGDVRLPSTTVRGGKFELADLNLDSPRVAPVGRIQAKRGKWRFALTGLGFNADDEGSTQTTAGQLGAITVAAGDRLVSDLSYESFDLVAGYRIWSHTSDTNDAGRVRFGAGVDLIGGLRFHHADFNIRNTPASAPPPGAVLRASADEFFAEPVIGARLDLAIDERFGIEVESLAGGFGVGDRTSGSFSIDAGFAYRPVHWAGVKVGYRLLVFGLNDGDGADEFEWSGSMAGLYFGAQFSF